MSNEKFRLKLWHLLVAACLVAMGAIFIGESSSSRLKNERRVTEERVQAAGGWQVVQRECESLLTNAALQSYREKGTYWVPHAGELPAGLESLQPRTVRFQVATSHPAVLELKLFGSGKTDWTPYFGLWIACGAGRTNYIPDGEAEGDHPYFDERVSDGVFEVYQK